MDDLDRLLDGLSVYQDVVLDGRTVRRGVRDCEARWRAIAPHLPASGALVDVGANFGWFCLRWCAEGEDRVAAAMEADLRSAAVARYALAGHAHRRIALLTARGGAAAMERFEQAEQRFDAALCLSVLHWIPDHRAFLAALARTADRIFVEHPDPREEGSGVAAIRREIGEIGPYLTSLFPDRRVERIATWESHRSADLPRELWLVADAADVRPQSDPKSTAAKAELDVAALLDLDIAWPPRSWWSEQLAEVFEQVDGRVLFTPHGVRFEPAVEGEQADDVAAMRRAIARIPEHGVTTVRRKLRRLGQSVNRRLRRMLAPATE